MSIHRQLNSGQEGGCRVERVLHYYLSSTFSSQKCAGVMAARLIGFFLFQAVSWAYGESRMEMEA